MQVTHFRILLLLIALNLCTRGYEIQDYMSFAEENLQDEVFVDESADYFTNYDSEGPTEMRQNKIPVNSTLTDLTAASVPFSEGKREEESGEEENVETNIGISVLEPNYLPRLMPTSGEVTSEKFLLNELSRIHRKGYNDFGKTLSNGEMRPNLAPMRRETNNWMQDLLENDMPWTYQSHHPHSVPQKDYLEFSERPYHNHQQNESASLNGPLSELPQYFQKNYYYNYYSAPRSGRYPNPANWKGEKTQVPRGKVSGGRRKSACKQYLQFLKYAFEQLDESSENQYDYADEYEAEPPRRGPAHPVITTQLMGPMLYIDNSGRVSQGHVKPEVFPKDFEQKLSAPTEPSLRTVDKKLQKFLGGNHFKIETTPASTTLVPSTEGGISTWGDPETTSQPPEFGSAFDSTETPPQTPPELLLNTFFDKILETDSPESTTKYETTEAPVDELTTYMKPFENTVDVQTNIELWSKYNWFFTPSVTPSWIPTISEVGSFDNQKENSYTELPYGHFNYGKPESDSSKKKDVDCNDKMLPCPDTFNLTYPLNGYCNRYVSCESGRAIRRICQEGLHFNIITKSCDIPHNSFCTYACPKPSGYFGIPGDCGGYFVCKNSVAEYRMCPPKMHWDIRKGICDFAESSFCPMTCSTTNEVKQYTGDCKAYVICLNGTPYYHKCPPSMKFDKKFLTCVPEHLSTCENDPRLLTKTLNPNKMCRDIQLKLGSKSWCNFFESTGGME